MTLYGGSIQAQENTKQEKCNQYVPKGRVKILLGGLIWEGGRASVLEPSDLVLKSDSIILAL